MENTELNDFLGQTIKCNTTSYGIIEGKVYGFKNDGPYNKKATIKEYLVVDSNSTAYTGSEIVNVLKVVTQ